MTQPGHEPDATPAPSASSKGEPRYPVNYVVGVVPTRQQAEAASSELTTRGFLESEVGVTSGSAAAEALDATTGRRGLADFAMRLGEWVGVSNHEMMVKEGYEQALRDGEFIVAALAPDDERKRLASEIIVSHGGRFVHYFNRFSIERLQR
jgi:hypothetical protein